VFFWLFFEHALDPIFFFSFFFFFFFPLSFFCRFVEMQPGCLFFFFFFLFLLHFFPFSSSFSLTSRLYMVPCNTRRSSATRLPCTLPCQPTASLPPPCPHPLANVTAVFRRNTYPLPPCHVNTYLPCQHPPVISTNDNLLPYQPMPTPFVVPTHANTRCHANTHLPCQPMSTPSAMSPHTATRDHRDCAALQPCRAATAHPPPASARADARCPAVDSGGGWRRGWRSRPGPRAHQ
jgi:hypothetical protein